MSEPSKPTSGPWRAIGELFEAALQQPPEARDAWVRRADVAPDVRDEVLSLLRAHAAAGSFLASPADATRGQTPEQNVRTYQEGSDPDIAGVLPTGTVVGPYRIAGVIGQGGMGVVYLADDGRLHRQVALKALPPRLARDERLRGRLRREARAAAALAHPGIATVFALEEVDGQLFIASEYLRGETLRAELGHGPLAPPRVVGSALDIARALAAAHERGIVHRDLKPENILRTDDGVLKILDFGLAQVEPGAEAGGGAAWTRITEPGLVAGTPGYMAPEQLLAHETDARTDHFAFGVLVYELATGRRPFEGTSLASTVAAVLAAPPVPLVADAGLPDGLWPVIARCLEKAPADRFPATTDLVRALERVASGAALLTGDAPTATPAQGARAGAARETRRPHGASGAADGATDSSAWWWRFHQLAAALAYGVAVALAWHVRPWLGRAGLLWFLLIVAASVVAASLRVHLWFSARTYPAELPGQRASVAGWVRAADWSATGLLILAGLSVVGSHADWSALLVAIGVANILVFLLIEPATARAAFNDQSSRRS